MSRWDGLTRKAVREIHLFTARLLEEGSASTVNRAERDAGRLAELLRLGQSLGGPATLLELVEQPETCARVLRDAPGINHDKASDMWHALRAFIALMVESTPEAAARVAAIEDRLVPRRRDDWDQTERVTGGAVRVEARRAQLLFADDLVALVQRAREGKIGLQAERDGALVALWAWSPLRPREICDLSWEQLTWEGADTSEGPFGAWTRCTRRGVELVLPLHRLAARPLAKLYASVQRTTDRAPAGEVFRTLRRPNAPLSYRETKEVVDEAFNKADTHPTRTELLAAYAYHLKTAYGLTVIDLKDVLGVCEVKVVRRILEEHERWELNRKVDRSGGPVRQLSLGEFLKENADANRPDPWG